MEGERSGRETQRENFLGGIKVGNNKMRFYWNYYCCKHVGNTVNQFPYCIFTIKYI